MERRPWPLRDRAVRRCLTDGAVEFLHREAMATVRVISDNAGQRARRLGYRPFGEHLVHTFNAAVVIGEEGFIGERHDAGAGLMYLNARCFDPELGLFLQQGWWEGPMRPKTLQWSVFSVGRAGGWHQSVCVQLQ
jgi:RHS repeat-associated protein